VARDPGGTTPVVDTLPDGRTRTIFFEKGKATLSDRERDVLRFLSAGQRTKESASPKLEKLLKQTFADGPGPIRYFARQVDLNGDGRTEHIVHVAGPMVCGTGGCDTLVLAQEDGGLRLVSRISITRPPIVVASTTTRGWRDLVVRMSGGGIIPGHDARLRFDARTYPVNPTVPPVEPLMAPASGEVAIPAFQSLTERRLLRGSLQESRVRQLRQVGRMLDDAGLEQQVGRFPAEPRVLAGKELPARRAVRPAQELL
jgi:hypothetical protein